MTTLDDARAAAENCWPMDMDGLPGNQSRKERELLRRGFELGYRVAVERLTVPPAWPCSTPGCPGDGRYAAPGRGHLGECRFPLTAPPTKDEREALAKRFSDLLFEHGLRSPDSTKAVIAFKEVAADFRRQGPITAAEVIAAAKWWAESGNDEHPWPEYVKPMRGVLEAAREVA